MAAQILKDLGIRAARLVEADGDRIEGLAGYEVESGAPWACGLS